MPPEAPLFRFVRGLLHGQAAAREGNIFLLPDGRRAPAAEVSALVQSGVLAGNASECRRNDLTAGWLRRALLDRDAFQAQHRTIAPGPGDSQINLAESPLSRLAAGKDAFLDRHHLEAGERVRRLVERAQLQPRLTMAYSASRTAGGRQQIAGEISDMAADARKALARIHDILPRDCAGVVLDVCGFLKGLQAVERERGWPRRSAKLVLRIGLEQLAEHYGLASAAEGRPTGMARNWMDAEARPNAFP